MKTQKNEGEGNKTADKQYRDGVRKHLKTHDVADEARKAADALDDPKEAKTLRKAEDAGRNAQKR